MSAKPAACLQMEFDRNRLDGYGMSDMWPARYADHRAHTKLVAHEIVERAMRDTLANGGTFVLVVTPEKITVVQRPDAEEL